MFSLPNLVSQVVEPCTPWTWTMPAPDKCVDDKAARDAWASSPSTAHQMYSGWEGVNSSLRVSETNPPTKLHHLPIDFDLKLSLVEVEQILSRLSIKPNWLEHTISGHWRAVWLLERPIPIASAAYARHLMLHLHTLVPINDFPGLDRNALSFSRYFTNSGAWRHIHDVPISWSTILGWLMKVGEKYRWADEPGIDLDLKAAATRLKEKFPRFAEWEGDFVLGAQGPTFWVEGSTSPKSAIVRERGMGTFAAHAHKSYFPWAELCGAEWLKQYETNRIGNAVKDIYYDDKVFFVLSPITGQWMMESKENVLNELLVNRGLNKNVAKKSSGKPYSEVDEAFAFIRHNNRVAGAASFAFFPKGILDWNNSRYLNIHTREVIQPAPAAAWGPDGGFPWLSAFLDQFFTTPKQLLYFLSWLSRFYKACYRRTPLSGQNVFLCGPTNAGKTFFSRGVIGKLMGGYADPKDWMMGRTSFNSQLFDYAYWTIDDASMGANVATQRYYSEMVKMLGANPDQNYQAKYGKPTQVGSKARLLVTCNMDSASLFMIPRQDISIMDKLMIFQAAERSIPFPEWEETEKIIARELPFFARFLLDYVIPDECRENDPRYGVKSHHEDYVINRANLSESSFLEVFHLWIRDHFNSRKPNDATWVGSSIALRQAIAQDPAMIELLREFKLEDIKRQLMKMSTSSPYKIEVVGDRENMEFKIHRPDPIKTPPTTEPPTSENSRFSK